MKNSNAKFNKISNLIISALFVFFFILSFLFLSLHPVRALTMSNDNYILQMGNFNMASGKPTSSTYKLGFTMGQTGPGLYTGTNYKVRAGFQYIHSIIPFRFSIDGINIDFGTLTATNPVTRTNTLIVSNGSAYGYSVTAYENHQLAASSSGAIIPDTTCDDGNCTEQESSIWDSNLTYGFGYRCDNLVGSDCASGFSDSRNYKQFADKSMAEISRSVMAGTAVSRSRKVTITYKVNISGTQQSGLYTNVLTYIATPTY